MRRPSPVGAGSRWPSRNLQGSASVSTATRMATDANFRGNRERLSWVVREPLPDIDPIEELRRTLGKGE